MHLEKPKLSIIGMERVRNSDVNLTWVVQGVEDKKNIYENDKISSNCQKIHQKKNI